MYYKINTIQVQRYHPTKPDHFLDLGAQMSALSLAVLQFASCTRRELVLILEFLHHFGPLNYSSHLDHLKQENSRLTN